MNSQIPLTNLDSQQDPSLIIDATQHNPAVRLAKGTFQRWRRAISGPLLLMFLLAPWLTLNGAPLLQMNLETRQLHLMGLTFWPDDLLMLLWLAMACAFALFAVATFAGRLWCGFACPQTVWTMMFIWVEEKIEGSRNQRLKKNKSGLSIDFRKIAKHSIWLAISFITGFTFVAFFESGESLFNQIITLNLSVEIAFWLVFFTALTYINGGWLREQVCMHMCPYSRFQSVMLDQKSLKVSYDVARGEPRNRKQTTASIETKSGDCVDCTLCVQVCPVGIDIRQGLQYACIDCGACIDACDEIMKKVDRPTGLIKFSNSVTTNWKELFTQRKRLWGYSSLAALSAIAFILQATFKETFDIHVTRDRGSLYFYNELGEVSNGYLIKIHNKSNEIKYIDLTLSNNALKFASDKHKNFVLQPNQQLEKNIRISCPGPCSVAGKQVISLGFQAKGGDNELIESNFFAPR